MSFRIIIVGLFLPFPSCETVRSVEVQYIGLRYLGIQQEGPGWQIQTVICNPIPNISDNILTIK
jgi:hypothetical protein